MVVETRTRPIVAITTPEVVPHSISKRGMLVMTAWATEHIAESLSTHLRRSDTRIRRELGRRIGRMIATSNHANTPRVIYSNDRFGNITISYGRPEFESAKDSTEKSIKALSIKNGVFKSRFRDFSERLVTAPQFNYEDETRMLLATTGISTSSIFKRG